MKPTVRIARNSLLGGLILSLLIMGGCNYMVPGVPLLTQLIVFVIMVCVFSASWYGAALDIASKERIIDRD